VLLIALVVLCCGVAEAFGQTTWFRRASREFNVSIDPGSCGDDNKCGPITARIYRKGSKVEIQTITGGRIFKSDIGTSVQFFDIDFDGRKDLLLFDGYTSPDGNATASQRIYLYSRMAKAFVFNESLSSLSHEESLDLESSRRQRKTIMTYARPGSGVFQWRTYRTDSGRPVMVEEVVSDSQVDNGTRTLVTTKKLVNGRWRTWTKHTKTIFNQ
jgi:hypothetical protein